MTDQGYRDFCDQSHGKMMRTQGNIVAYLEVTMDPCQAINTASQMMKPAFDAWNELITLIEEENKTEQIVRDELAKIKAELQRQSGERKAAPDVQ